MLANERRAHIVNVARSQGVVRVSDLVAELGVSSMTVRRDLDALAGRGFLDKFHGGASLRRLADAGTAQLDDVAENPLANIGVMIPSNEYYFGSILAGIRSALDGHALRRSLVRPQRDPDEERKLIEELVASGSTGLVLAPSINMEQPDTDYAEQLLSLPVPAVLVEREVRDDSDRRALSAVRTDHEYGCRVAVEHLKQLGHQGVALVTHGGSQSGFHVIDGWREAVRDAGMRQRQSPLLVSESGPGFSSNPRMDRILDGLRDSRATALICHSDELSLPLVHRAKVRGWRIPDELSVIAHDDEAAEMADPPLTAVSPPKAWIGRTAVLTLLDLFAEGVDAPVRRIIAQPRLVLRSSTAVPTTSALA